jgi:diguanylate cyclase (GGDEF)-like protein/PAS domain S-box-containing protein
MVDALAHVLHCIRHEHDPALMWLSGLVCLIGVYASFAIANHALRVSSALRLQWGLVGVLSAGCTAWATHFVVMLAYEPGVPVVFDLWLTVLSLIAAFVGIGAGIAVAIAKTRWPFKHFTAGLIIGFGVTALHYIGQYAYQIPGRISWDWGLISLSIVLSLPIFGAALWLVASPRKSVRKLGAPVLVLGIAVLHFCGMAATTLHFDRNARLPTNALSPEAVAPVVASVTFALVVLAIMGWWFDFAATRRRRQDRQRLGELADVALEGLLIYEGEKLVTANSSMEMLSGYDKDQLREATISSLFPGIDTGILPEREEREAQLVGRDGRIVPVRVLRRELALATKKQTVIAVRDQSERLRTEQRIRTLAYEDPLTELPNRTRFFDLLAAHASSHRSVDHRFAVLMLDLDRFKPINDAFGHAAGDQILRLVAKRGRALTRGEDIVARLGGDEFAILQLSANDANDARTLAKRIIKSLEEEPFLLEEQAVYLGTSVGIAMVPHDDDDPAGLLDKADLALYAAKSDGRGSHRCYDASLDVETLKRRELELGLRRAIDSDSLDVAYQPLIDAKTCAIVSAEALVRWNHSELGLVPPLEFVVLAEETDLILKLGDWVLRRACKDAAQWPSPVNVAVNLSPAQFRDNAMVEKVAAALEASGLPASRLELEITEGVLLNDHRRTLDILGKLRAMGVSISMDDFGTGYSSLSYLRKFPFDKLKIDQAFVSQIPHDTDSIAIVRAIVTMSKVLGLRTVAEGVETQAQFEFCVAEGCELIQGYYVDRPLTNLQITEAISHDSNIMMAVG